MKNKEILFDETLLFRTLDKLRVFLKYIFTKCRLRNKQSCKHCGRDQSIVWRVEDHVWERIPKKYHNKALCLECFISMYPGMFWKDDIVSLNFLTKLSEDENK